MDEKDLEELKGEVDFDFFDDGPSVTPDIKGKDDKIDFSSKPPPSSSRKSPSPFLQATDSKKNSPESKPSDRQVTKDGDVYTSSEESYSSDSVSESDEEEANTNNNRSSNARPEAGVNKQSGDRKIKRRSPRVSSSSASDSDSESDTERSSRVSPQQKSRDVRNRSDSDSYTSETDSESSSYTDSEPEKISKSVPSQSPSRPTTAHARQKKTKKDAWSSENRSKGKGERSKDGKGERSKVKKGVKSDSESEITDVSPLSSPDNTPRVKRKHEKKTEMNGGPYNNHDNRGYNDLQQEVDAVDQVEDLDLNILIKAVSDLEKEKRIKSNTRRVMFAPNKPSENYSYSKERAKMIERENQRLLNEILQHHVDRQEQPVARRKYEPMIRRLTPSAINRERQQKKIEAENMALLKRLQKAKPSRGMSKAEQDEEYRKTMLYGVPVSILHSSRPKSRTSSPWDDLSSPAHMGSRTRSMNSVASVSTVSSAKSTARRPLSAKKRPEWNDRW